MTIHLSNPQNIDNRDPFWTMLMSSIFTQAIRDARDADPLKALDAVCWLLSPDAHMYVEALGLDENSNPVLLITTGRLRNLRLSKKNMEAIDG